MFRCFQIYISSTFFPHVQLFAIFFVNFHKTSHFSYNVSKCLAFQIMLLYFFFFHLDSIFLNGFCLTQVFLEGLELVNNASHIITWCLSFFISHQFQCFIACCMNLLSCLPINPINQTKKAIKWISRVYKLKLILVLYVQ